MFSRYRERLLGFRRELEVEDFHQKFSLPLGAEVRCLSFGNVDGVLRC